MARRLRIRLPLTRRHVGGLIAAIAGLNILVLLGAYIRSAYHLTWMAADWKISYLVSQFNVAAENTFAVWYSSLLLLGVAFAAAVCFLLDRRHIETPVDRILSYGWVIIAFLFVLLSFDESGSLHEGIADIAITRTMLEPLSVGGASSWVALLVIPIVAVGLFFLGFAFLRLREAPAALALVIIGVLLFFSIPAQEELEIITRRADGAWERPPVLMILEEGAEIFGSFAFLAAFAEFARTRYAADSGREVVFDPGTTHVLSTVALLATGLLTAWYATGRILEVQPGRGFPVNWFPGVLAFITSLAILELWRQNYQRAASFWPAFPFLLLAFLSLFLSFDHGAAQSFTEQLSDERDAHRFILDVGFVAVVLIVALVVLIQPLSRSGRIIVTAWALLSMTALLAGGQWNPVLSFGAYAVLFPAVMGGVLFLNPAREGEPESGANHERPSRPPT